MKTLGVDVGSRYVKLAAYSGDEPVFAEMADTIAFYTACRTPAGLDLRRLDTFKNRPFDFDRIVSTGYGRYNVKLSGAEVISEIRAHALGATYQTGLSDFTLLDIGGQDTKVIRVRAGEVDDFVMNDKCAAGSGRYLENISRMLGVPPEEMGNHSQNPVELSVTCAIFGESEVIGNIAEGVAIGRICAGANLSVAQRLVALVRRFPSPAYVVTGGVAKNGAVLEFLSQKTGAAMTVPEHPVFNGAIGCALMHTARVQ